MPLSEVRQVFLSDGAIYPSDNADKKEAFLDLVVKLDLLTLLDDPQGRLEGFLVCFRSWHGEALSRTRPEEQTGNGVTVDNIWVRPDLRGDGRALRRLMRYALIRNQTRNAGAEKIYVHWRQAPEVDVFRGYDYPKFYRKYAE